MCCSTVCILYVLYITCCTFAGEKPTLTITIAPAIDAIEYETIKLQGALHDQNPFRGPPSPAIDAAWQEILNSKYACANTIVTIQAHTLVVSEIKVDPRDMPRLKKPSTQAKYPDDEGGWYIGILEVTHQVPSSLLLTSVQSLIGMKLHCVNLIRQYTYFDYYSRPENWPVAFGDKNHTLRLHIGTSFLYIFFFGVPSPQK